MKFKVGDRVRLTREGMRRMSAEWAYIDDIFVDGSMIKRIKDELVCVKWTNKLIHESHFELVPENPEFEYGEEIDVYSYYDKSWVKAIFISKIPWNVWCKHACVTPSTEEKFKTWETFEVQLWRTARKPCLQITRKEIAEKLWISEDFVLIDDVNQDEI